MSKLTTDEIVKRAQDRSVRLLYKHARLALDRAIQALTESAEITSNFDRDRAKRLTELASEAARTFVTGEVDL